MTYDDIIKYLKYADTATTWINETWNYSLREEIVQVAKTLSSLGAKEDYWIACPPHLLNLFSQDMFEPIESDQKGVYLCGEWFGRWDVYVVEELKEDQILIASGYEEGSPCNYAKITVLQSNDDFFFSEDEEI